MRAQQNLVRHKWLVRLTCVLIGLAACSAPRLPSAPAPATPSPPAPLPSTTGLESGTVSPAVPPLPIAPLAQPPPGRYLFVELHRTEERRGLPTTIAYEHPLSGWGCGYYFDAAAGSLEPLCGARYVMAPELWGFLGHRLTQTEATGTKLSTSPGHIGQLPQTIGLFVATGVQSNGEIENRYIPTDLLAIASDGTIALSIDGDTIVLAPGQSWARRDQVAVNAPVPGVYSETQRLTNYGWQDRLRLGWSHPRFAITTDGGASWNVRRAQVDASAGAWLVDCPTQATCYLVNDSGGGPLLVTADGGQTWQRHFGLIGSADALRCPVAGVCFVLQSWIEPPHSLYRTTDGGAHWAQEPLDAPVRAIECPAAATCLRAGPGSLLTRTTDGGESWHALPISVPYELQGANCVDIDRRLVVGRAPDDQPPAGIILATRDGGQTWTVQSTAATPPLLDVSCADAATCLAVGPHGFLATADGGRSWTAARVLDSPGTLLSGSDVDCPAPGHCYVVNYQRGQGIWSTHDGGHTWREAWFLDAEIYTFRSISCPDARTCYATAAPY